MYSNKGCVSSKPSMFYLPPPPSTPITLPRRHRKVTVTDPANSFVVMLRCRLNRHYFNCPINADGNIRNDQSI